MSTPYQIVVVTARMEVRQYEGSSGYQIWRDGKFYVFASTLEIASQWVVREG